MKLFYSPTFTCAQHSFDTTRKATWVAESLTARPITGVDLVEPVPLTVDDVLLAHGRDYVDAVRTGEPRGLAESQGFPWSPGMWEMALSVNGGVLAAARQALAEGVSGSLSSGLHHAKRNTGDGFCTFNGLVIAARRLLAEGEVSSVLILDLDAHCGGGTAALIDDEDRITQFDVSVSMFDAYAGTGNATLREVHSAADYPGAVRSVLAAASRFDLCLYNAGMDPHERCATGGLDGISAVMLAERERLVFDWCRRTGTPVAFALAGGYVGPDLTAAEVVNLHRLTITEANRAQCTRKATA